MVRVRRLSECVEGTDQKLETAHAAAGFSFCDRRRDFLQCEGVLRVSCTCHIPQVDLCCSLVGYSYLGLLVDRPPVY